MRGAEVWTEVLTEGAAVTWVWTGADLMAVPYAIGEHHLDADTMDAIGRYSENKEFDLYIDRLYDESDFEGSLEDFLREIAQ